MHNDLDGVFRMIFVLNKNFFSLFHLPNKPPSVDEVAAVVVGAAPKLKNKISISPKMFLFR